MAMTDADIETMELRMAARDAENGVCSICEDPLDPMNPKWRDKTRLNAYLDEDEARMVAECVGPIHPDLPYHARCVEDVEAGNIW